MMEPAKLSQIAIHPIKGLAARNLDAATLTAKHGLVGDRKFAFTTNQDVDGSVWKSTRAFITNAHNDGLLKISWAKKDNAYTVTNAHGRSLSLRLNDPTSLENFNRALPELMTPIIDPSARVRLVERGSENGPSGHWDYPDSELLLINLETIRFLEDVLERTIDPRRFRANLTIDQIPAWGEFGLAGHRMKLGTAQIEFGRPARRCPALSVNPDTAERDFELHKLLAEKFGHAYFGIYGRVINGGAISVGDVLEHHGVAEVSHQSAQVEGAAPYPLWPKLAEVVSCEPGNGDFVLTLQSVGAWPLVDELSGASLKLHCAPNAVCSAKITEVTAPAMTVRVPEQDLPSAFQNQKSVIVTGPYKR